MTLIDKENPKVGVVIPTLGRNLDWLRLSLFSIVSQEVPSQIVLVAQPTTELQTICLEFGAQLMTETGDGLSSAINQGVDALGNTEFVAWLGDDDILSPESLTWTLRALKSDPLAPFAFGQVRHINADGSSRHLLRSSRLAISHAKWGRNFIPQPGSLIRHMHWNQVGGLDTSLNHAMDQDLFLKLSDLGRPLYVPRELAAFRVHSGSISVRKGSQFETLLVSRRYRTSTPLINGLARAMVYPVDRVLLSLLPRLPSPPPPNRNGSSYTVSG